MMKWRAGSSDHLPGWAAAGILVLGAMSCWDSTGPDDIDAPFTFEEVVGPPLTSAYMEGIWSQGSTVVAVGNRRIIRSSDGGENWVEVGPQWSLDGVWGEGYPWCWRWGTRAS